MTEGRIVARDILDRENNIDVSDHDHISFMIGGRMIRVSIREGRLSVNSDGQIDIRPEASNAFSVGFAS